MRILFLHEVNYLTKPIFEMHEFPEELAALGHDVGFVHFPESFGAEMVSDLQWVEQVPGRTRSNVSLRLYTPRMITSGLLGRLVAAAVFPHQFRRVLRDFRPDVVVSYAVPTSGWQALHLCRKSNIPYVFRALDVSHKIRKSVFSALIKRAETFIYSNASWVSTNNPAMRDYCLSMGASEEKSSVELPPLNFEHFDRPVTLDVREMLGIAKDAKVALYMGSFFYFSGLSEVLRSYASSRKEGEVLVLVGGGEQELELKSLARELDISSYVYFTGFVSFDQLPSYLAAADVAFNSMEPSLVSNAAFPNKVIQYMAAGLPIVSTNLAGLAKTFDETVGLRYVVTPEDIYAEVQKLFRSRDLAELGMSNRSLASITFSMEGAVADFEKLIVLVRGQ